MKHFGGYAVSSYLLGWSRKMREGRQRGGKQSSYSKLTEVQEKAKMISTGFF